MSDVKTTDDGYVGTYEPIAVNVEITIDRDKLHKLGFDKFPDLAGELIAEIYKAIDAAYWQKTYNEMISDYRENPDEFARDYLGINLRWYQKLMLRLMSCLLRRLKVNSMTNFEEIKRKIANMNIDELMDCCCGATEYTASPLITGGWNL